MFSRDKSAPSLTASDLSHHHLTAIDLANPKPTDSYLFISDLHLCATRPHTTSAFLSFLQNTATQSQALFILGDLFEYWAGDDDIEDAFHQQIIIAFRTLADKGVQIYLMHGNRDFLISQQFCNAAKVRLIHDPILIELHGKKTLLSHGDDLCTDDTMYQTFRRQVRDEKWQSEFLSQPLEIRKKQIENIRMHSEQEKSQKSAQIMDVNADAVNVLLQTYQYPELLIHGHTHRPNQHHIVLDDHRITRWVLGDWYEQGSYLVCNQLGCHDMRLS
jgi:UDP-2,3-diacylglucosamine hydrolase